MKPVEILCRINSQYGEETRHVQLCMIGTEGRKEVRNLHHAHIQLADSEGEIRFAHFHRV